MYKPLSSMART